jgi:serine/threonine-protein kinase
MACLDEEIVLALLDHALEPARTAGVQRHLDGCAACRMLVAALARELPPPGEEPEPGASPAVGPDPAAVAEGTRVGAFVVMRGLGAWPGGKVYLAHHSATGARVWLRELGDPRPAPREALAREVEARAAVRHPGLLPLHGLAEHEGRLYLASGLPEGRPLEQWLQVHPGEVAARELLRVIARALEALHAGGFAHGSVGEEAIVVGRAGPMLLDGLPRPPGATAEVDWVALRALAQRMGTRLERRRWRERLRSLLSRRR